MQAHYGSEFAPCLKCQKRTGHKTQICKECRTCNCVRCRYKFVSQVAQSNVCSYCMGGKKNPKSMDEHKIMGLTPEYA